MKPEKQKRNLSSPKKGRRSNLLFIPILVMLAIGMLFFLTLHQNDAIKSSRDTGNTQSSIWEQITRTVSEDFDRLKHALIQKKTQEGSTELKQNQLQEDGQISAPKNNQQAAPLTGSEQSASTATKTSTPSGPEEASKLAVDKINTFYSHLDAQPYVQEFHLEKPSNVIFSGLIQKLLDNRPVITRETDDLLTVVKNTAHFFRIIGKDDIVFLKTILEKEKTYLEDMLADYYYLAESPDDFPKTLSLQIPADALYEYAGFFLNTMGGRLYLFRRDPVTRMTVSYYCILIIDKANRESSNRDGIQIKQAVDSLIADIESGGNQLRFKEKYLDKLYELKEKYQ